MAIKTTVSEFKAFVLKGNVVDLAVGVVIGAAFKSVVDSMVTDLITPLVGAMGGNPDFSQLYLGSLAIGKFLNSTLAFVILAAVIFFLVVKPMNALAELTRKAIDDGSAPPPPPPPEDIRLLTEIRDLLKARPASATPAQSDTPTRPSDPHS